MGKLEELWERTVFDENDPGEKYVEMIIKQGTSAPLIDLPYDSPLPSFYDRNLFKRAQEYYNSYSVFIATTHVIGVMILFGLESILDILACTKQSSTPVAAFKRYTETIFLINNIFKYDPEDPESKCFKSMLAIRKKHKHGSDMGMRRTNRFINQRDMAITQNSFMGHVITCFTQFGMPYDPENMLAMCHLWRVVGYMLGIEDRFNLCNGDLPTVRARSNAIFRHMIIPGLLQAPKDFQMMTEAYFNGIQGISSEFEVEKFIFITQRLSQVPGYYVTEKECADQILYMKKYPHYIPSAQAIEEDMISHPQNSKAFQMLKWSHRWDIIFTEFLLLKVVPNSTIVKDLFNFIHTCRLFFLKYFPVLAIYRFGYQNAYVSVLDD